MRQDTNMRRRLAASAIFLAAIALAAGQAAAQSRGPEVLGFTKSFVVEIANPSPLLLENHVVVIDVADIRASVAPDFNTSMYAFFDARDGEYALVVSQADDLDRDRRHDEIVLVRTLPPSATTRLLCYYTPGRSFQLMPSQKAYARASWETGGPEAGWESNLAAFAFVRGGIGFYGKLQPGLVLKKLPAPSSKEQDWGMAVLEPGDTAGLGGLSLWDGGTRIPLFGPSAPRAKVTVLAPGPVRALVQAEYPPVRTAAGEVALTVRLSAFADSAFSRQDVVLQSKSAGPIVYGPGLGTPDGGAWTLDEAAGFVAVWGKGAKKAGEIGLAAIFPPDALSGTDETASDRAVRLEGRAGRMLTHWVVGAWERGVGAPGVPAAKNWARKVGEMAGRLLVPVKVEFKAR
jgi:hypothetical protein